MFIKPILIIDHVICIYHYKYIKQMQVRNDTGCSVIFFPVILIWCVGGQQLVLFLVLEADSVFLSRIATF